MKKFVFITLLLPSLAFAQTQNISVQQQGMKKISGTTLGEQDASQLDTSCIGFIPKKPNYKLTLKKYGVFAINIKSENDLTLVVKDTNPKAEQKFYCNDDYYKKKDPQVEIPTIGTFEIYIGTKKQGEKVQYTGHIADSAG